MAKASVLSDAFINLINKKSVNAVGTLHYESSPQSNNLKNYADISLQSTQDLLTPGSIKSDQILKVDTNLIPINSTLEIKLIGDTFYIKIPVISYKEFALPFASYERQWISFNKEDITAISKDEPEIKEYIQNIYDTLMSINNKPISELSKVSNLVKEYSPIIIEKKIGSKTDNGISEDKYSLTLDTNALISKLTSNINSSMGTASRNYQIKAIKDSVNSIKIKNGLIYVGKKDRLPYELSFTAQQYDSVNHKVISTFDFDFTFSDFGSNFDSIIAPTSVTTATDFYNNTIKKSLDEARLKGQKAAMKASLSEMRPVAELIYENTNSYGTTSNLGNCTTPTPGSVFNPILKGYSSNQSDLNMQTKNILNNVINYSSSYLCYSTTSSWAMQGTYKDGNGSFCVDSTGVAKETTTAITGPVCGN